MQIDLDRSGKKLKQASEVLLRRGFCCATMEDEFVVLMAGFAIKIHTDVR